MNGKTKFLICAMIIIAIVACSGIAFAGTSTAPGQLKKHTPTITPTTIPTTLPTTIPTVIPTPTPTIDPTQSVWTRSYNYLSYNTQSWEQNTGGALAIINDTNPYILTDKPYVLKMWYQAALSPQNTGYAESGDYGTTWVKYSGNPVITGSRHGAAVVKHNGVFYAFPTNAFSNIEIWKSNNGVTEWKQIGVAFYRGSGWDALAVGLCDVWVEGDNNWKMLYSGYGSSSWQIGLATSNDVGDPLKWTKNPTNPVIIKSPGFSAVPLGIYKDTTGRYWEWVGAGDIANARMDGGDMMRYTSTDLVNWQANPNDYTFKSDGSPTEGSGYSHQLGSAGGIISTPEGSRLFYNYYNGAPNDGYAGTSYATSPLTIEQIVHTNENAGV